MSIDAAVAQKLCDVLEHERVYPDFRWLTTDETTGEFIKLPDPVVMYRQTGGSGGDSLDQGRGTLRDDFFLIEVFADGRDECTAVKDALLAAFGGPAVPASPGDWATWSGLPVKWAQIDDPEAGSEIPESEPYLLFRFVRMVLQVQWYKE